MNEQEQWIQASFLRRSPFRGLKESPVRAYIPKSEPTYGLKYPRPISIPRTRILEYQAECLIAAVGEERKIVVFEKHRGEKTEYRYRKRNTDDPVGVIRDFWYPKEGITIFPNHIEGLKVLEKEELNQATVEEIGGKAYGLVKLKQLEKLGFKVPDFFVIPTGFYHKLNNIFGFEGRAEEIIATYTPDEIMRESDYDSRSVPGEIYNLFSNLGYPENFYPLFWEKIVSLSQWGSMQKDRMLYFRSSSPLEDGRKYAFPGVFESQLVESSSQSWFGLESVLLSPWSAYAEHYLRSQGLAGKATRAMAVIVQEVPSDIRFTGRIFVEGDRLEIEYVDGVTWRGDYKGTKVVLNKDLDIIDAISPEERGFGLVYWRAKRDKKNISEERVKRLAELSFRIGDKLPEYGRLFNLEFLLGEKMIYLVQIRPTIRKKEEVTVDLKSIDSENIIRVVESRFTDFSLGRVEGRLINLLNIEPEDLDEEWLSSIDEQYPGAIYVVSHFPVLTPGGIARVSHYQIMNRETHLLTPRKKGVIVCSPTSSEKGGFHDHFTEVLRNDPCFLIYAPTEWLENLPTGEPIGIVSDGKRAIIYKGKGEAESFSSLPSSTEKPWEKRYYYYGQPMLPGFKSFQEKDLKRK